MSVGRSAHDHERSCKGHMIMKGLHLPHLATTRYASATSSTTTTSFTATTTTLRNTNASTVLYSSVPCTPPHTTPHYTTPHCSTPLHIVLHPHTTPHHTMLHPAHASSDAVPVLAISSLIRLSSIHHYYLITTAPPPSHRPWDHLIDALSFSLQRRYTSSHHRSPWCPPS